MQGADLHFSTEASHIPESLKQHPLLTLRITHVDEEAKRMLLYAQLQIQSVTNNFRITTQPFTLKYSK